MARDDDYRRGRDDRDDDRGRSRASRDDDRGGRDRERDDRGSRDRDDSRDRGRDRDRDDDRGRGRDRDDRGGGGRGGFAYHRRDDADAARRAQGNSKFDKYINGDIKLFKPREGTNIIRILPPTWKDAKHYGYDIWTHFGVGADENTYLCLQKMRDQADAYFERNRIDGKGGDDPVEEEVRQLQRDGYEKEAKEAKHKLRVGIYLIDRNDERAGVQFWLMGEQIDREIVSQSMDKRKGTALAIDDPDEGFDLTFERKGTGKNTKYQGVSVDRDSSPLGNDRWIQWAMDHPIPEQLLFYPYDHIKTQLGGGGSHRGRDDRDDDRGGHGRDRDDDRSSRSSREDSDRGRDRGGREDADSRGRERDAGRDVGSRDSGRGRDSDDRGRSRDDDRPTWESIHGMSGREMEDLIDLERLDIDPKKAKSDEDLADWICEEMKLKSSERAPDRDEGRQRRTMNDDGDKDDRGEKLNDLRRRRESRD